MRGSNFETVKLNKVLLPTACRHCHISSKEAVFPGRNDVISLNASVLYGEYNEKFDFDLSFKIFKTVFKENDNPRQCDVVSTVFTQHLRFLMRHQHQELHRASKLISCYEMQAKHVAGQKAFSSNVVAVKHEQVVLLMRSRVIALKKLQTHVSGKLV